MILHMPLNNLAHFTTWIHSSFVIYIPYHDYEFADFKYFTNSFPLLTHWYIAYFTF